MSKAYREGQTLVTKRTQTLRTRSGREVTVEVEERLSLSDDGQVMTVEVTRRGPRGERVRRLVYTKA